MRKTVWMQSSRRSDGRRYRKGSAQARHKGAVRIAIVLLAAGLATGSATAQAPLEAYGALPSVSLMAISPSGARIAYHKVDGDVDAIIVQDLVTGELVAGTQASAIKPRDLTFVSEDYLLIFASETAERFARRYNYERTAALVLDLKSGEVRQLLAQAREIYPSQTGLGAIVGSSADGRYVYMPAFARKRSIDAPRFSLFRVGLKKRSDKIIEEGGLNTIDWFVDADGKPIVEEQFDNEENEHRVWYWPGSTRKLLFKENTDQPRIDIVGLTPTGDALVVRAYPEGSEHIALYRLPFATGELEGPIFAHDDKSVVRPLTGIDRVVYGVEYSGFSPTYEFFDPALTAWAENIQAALEGASGQIVSWTPGFDALLLRISGGWTSGSYVIVERNSDEPQFVAEERPLIPAELVVETRVIEYAARDGLPIPALLTGRRDVYENGDAPLIVMPHGGPESHDEIAFDWMAQYFAGRGYLVLQPQFRGSSGFGASLVLAGRGEWGKKMSTDLDDGVRFLVDKGSVAADRVCMVGASYGGYAALAAAAFSDFEYACVASIAGISDLPLMLSEARQRYGRRHWVVAYWRDQFATADDEKAELSKISPVEYPQNFETPVLLVHGKHDTIVPLQQSERMYDALTGKSKDVTLLRLSGEDHYLSKRETRIKTLEAVAEFVDQHL